MTNGAGHISIQFASCDLPIRQDPGCVPQAINCKPHAIDHKKQAHSNNEKLSSIDTDNVLTFDHPTKLSVAHNRVSSASHPQHDPRQLSAGSTTDLEHLFTHINDDSDTTVQLIQKMHGSTSSILTPINDLFHLTHNPQPHKTATPIKPLSALQVGTSVHWLDAGSVDFGSAPLPASRSANKRSAHYISSLIPIDCESPTNDSFSSKPITENLVSEHQVSEHQVSEKQVSENSAQHAHTPHRTFDLLSAPTKRLRTISCHTTNSGDKTLGLASHLATHESRYANHITPPAPDSRSLSVTQLANYYHTIIAEIHNFYGSAGLYQRRYPQAYNSVSKVITDALSSPKRLFLHKLRNELCTTPSGFDQYQNAFISVLPPAKPNQARATFQVQALYTFSKFDRVEGLYRPLKHELLSNFAWLYAGLKSGALSKKAKPKAINLMLANPTNLPQNSKIDADKLFRKGIRAKGLSALGYELSFLLAANFKVQRPKLDKTSGLTKIKLTPPDGSIDSFNELLRKSASGFLQLDYRQPEARARDVENFLNAARKNTDWLHLLDNI